ncbi:MAG: FtsW/RodA/SpoVE family cell cycle protein, partial [Acidimicrobiales bacterium]
RRRRPPFPPREQARPGGPTRPVTFSRGAPATAPFRRRTELGLIVAAAVLTASLYSLASLGRSASLPADVGPFLAVILALFGTAHLAMRFLAPDADGTLLPLAAILNGIGYVFIARLDPDLAALQAVWTALGVGAFVGTLALVRRVRDLERYRYSFALLGVGLLLMPLLPGVGRSIRGARLWVSAGGINFQPGELAKVALAVFFAAYLVEKRELLAQATAAARGRALGPIVLAWGASLLVMTMEKDLGSSLLFFALFISMLWVATGQGTYLAVGAGLFSVGAAFAYSAFGHVQTRVETWLDPWSRADDQGYQLVQAAYAFGSGGFGGTGPGLGLPGKIPAATTDFIFAAIGEELGLLGAAAVLITFVLIVGAGLRIAVRADQPFEKLLAAGLTTILAVQTFVIVGGVIRVVPLTGVTLPFMSYGGSSLVAN